MTAEQSDVVWKTALLSQLYVTWVTSTEGESQILQSIQQVLDDAQKYSSSGSSFPPKSADHLASASTTSPHRASDGQHGGSSGDLHSEAAGPSNAFKGNLGVKTTHFVRSPTREVSPPSNLTTPSGPQYLPGHHHGSASLLASHTDPNMSLSTTTTNTAMATVQDIPSFYSKNLSQGILASPNEEEITLLDELLAKSKGTPLTKESFLPFSSLVFKIPLWMKDLLFDRIVERTQDSVPQGSPSPDEVTAAQVSEFFKNSCACLSQTRRLFEIIKGDPDRDYITLEDLKTMAKYLVAVHKGLEFLEQPEFQDYYSRTVAIRIMYALEHQQAKKIFWQDFNRSSLPDVVHQLDSNDVNKVLEYFSYEHFYVLYCKFWELDTDRDLHLNYFDMCNYGQGMLTPLVVKRVVDGYGRTLSSGNKKFLDYEDFIYFCLSEEDKNSQAAVYYWFKVLDLDADGILSGYELSFFVAENQQRLAECFDTEKPPSYEDMMCQMLDMLGVDPQRMKSNNGGLTLADFRACPTPANFFNMIFNASKFCMFESRDPFSDLKRQMSEPEKTDWDRFARAEYDRMAAESQ